MTVLQVFKVYDADAIVQEHSLYELGILHGPGQARSYDYERHQFFGPENL